VFIDGARVIVHADVPGIGLVHAPGLTRTLVFGAIISVIAEISLIRAAVAVVVKTIARFRYRNLPLTWSHPRIPIAPFLRCQVERVEGEKLGSHIPDREFALTPIRLPRRDLSGLLRHLRFILLALAGTASPRQQAQKRDAGQ